MAKPELITRLENFIRETRAALLPSLTDDATYYNGKDTTQYEWYVNGCIAPIGIQDSRGKWILKISVDSNGDAVATSYPLERENRKEIKRKSLFDSCEMWELYELLERSTDAKAVWNPKLSKIKWEV